MTREEKENRRILWIARLCDLEESGPAHEAWCNRNNIPRFSPNICLGRRSCRRNAGISGNSRSLTAVNSRRLTVSCCQPTPTYNQISLTNNSSRGLPGAVVSRCALFDAYLKTDSGKRKKEPPWISPPGVLGIIEKC